MHHQQERTHGCRVSDSWTYRGLKTVVLENELVRVIVLADKGADIYSFVHKPSDTEFMFRTPWGVRDQRRSVSSTGHPGTVWMDYYEGGWQTVVPHGGHTDSSPVYGVQMGLHGDVNLSPWDVQIAEDTAELVAVKFRTRSARMPLMVEKTMTLESGSGMLRLDESVTNEGEEPVNVVWLEHIAIGPPFLDDQCRLFIPQEATVLSHPEDTAPTSKLKPGFRGNWPMVDGKDGAQIDFRAIPPKEDRSLDMAYFTDMKHGWYALSNRRSGVGWGVSFPSNVFKYLWYWRNLGGGWGYPWYGRSYNVGLEPCTSFHNGGLKQAIDNGTALQIGAGDRVDVTINAGAFKATGDVLSVTADGKVEQS